MMSVVDREQAIQELDKINSSVMRDKTLPGSPVLGVDLERSSATDDILPYLCQLPELKWLYLDQTRVTNRVLEALQVCTSLTALTIGDTPITDEGLRNLKYVPSLERLLLGSQITERGLRHLAHLAQSLKELCIPDTLITEFSLGIIAGLKNLESLTLYCEEFTEMGLHDLQSLPKLTTIQISHRVFPDALRLSLVAQLEKCLPKCRIEH